MAAFERCQIDGADPRYYPLFSAEDAEQMYDDARAFVEDSIWSENGSVVDLFQKPFKVPGDPENVRRRGILSVPACACSDV